VNTARDHRLRLRVATGVDAPRVVADAAFGPVERRVPDVPADEQRAERVVRSAPLHRYVSLYGSDRGATVYSDGLAEYEADDDGAVAVTLVRAVGELSRPDLPERPGHAGLAGGDARGAGRGRVRRRARGRAARPGRRGDAGPGGARRRRRARSPRRGDVAGAARPAGARGRVRARGRGARVRRRGAVRRRRVGGAPLRERHRCGGRRRVDAGGTGGRGAAVAARRGRWGTRSPSRPTTGDGAWRSRPGRARW
jgi:hypothetical protein